MLELHEAAGHFVERAVAAHGDYHVVLTALPGGIGGSVPRSSGAVDGEQISALAEDGGGVKQRRRGLIPTGPGIDDHQKGLLWHNLIWPPPKNAGNAQR